MELSAIDPEYYTVEEYLELEEHSPEGVKYEYADGRVRMMSGATTNHNLITANIATALNVQLRESPCLVLSGDMRIRVRKDGDRSAYRYADVTVACEEPKTSDEKPESLLNPTVIVEVLSDSTEKIDRDQKMREYMEIASLRAYVLVSQREARVETFQREGETDEWIYKNHQGQAASFKLKSIDCDVSLENVYRKVVFEQDKPKNEEPQEADEQI